MAGPLRGWGAGPLWKKNFFGNLFFECSNVPTAIKLEVGGGWLGLNGPAIKRKTCFCGFPSFYDFYIFSFSFTNFGELATHLFIGCVSKKIIFKELHQNKMFFFVFVWSDCLASMASSWFMLEQASESASNTPISNQRNGVNKTREKWIYRMSSSSKRRNFGHPNIQFFPCNKTRHCAIFTEGK